MEILIATLLLYFFVVKPWYYHTRYHKGIDWLNDHLSQMNEEEKASMIEYMSEWKKGGRRIRFDYTRSIWGLIYGIKERVVIESLPEMERYKIVPWRMRYVGEKEPDAVTKLKELGQYAGQTNPRRAIAK